MPQEQICLGPQPALHPNPNPSAIHENVPGPAPRGDRWRGRDGRTASRLSALQGRP